MPTKVNEDTLDATPVDTNDLKKEDLRGLVERQRESIEAITAAHDYYREQAEKATKSVNDITKTAEDVIRSMHLYSQKRLEAVFAIQNAVQVLFEQPNYNKEND